MESINFINWLQQELNRRGWGQAELARSARIAQSHLSRIMSGQRKPGPEVCTSIANALHIPPVEVFVKAGLLPPEPEKTSEEDEMIAAFRSLPKEDREAIIRFARARALESLRISKPQKAEDTT